MKLLFKQRIFSWFDSYDIYDEEQQPRYHVKGVMSLGHRLQIYDRDGNMLGEIKEKAFSFLPTFTMYIDGEEVGTIQKELTFLRPKFHLTCNDWEVDGNVMEWDYAVVSQSGHIMDVHKELFQLSDTYTMDIVHEKDALLCLMIVLAIDAAKCSQGE